MTKDSSARHGSKQATGYSLRVAAITGFVLALSVGFIDLSISMLSSSPGLDSFVSVLPLLATTLSVYFLIHIIVWFLVAIPLGRLLGLQAIPLTLGVSIFLWIGFALASTSGLVRSDVLSLMNWIKLFVVVLISLFLSAEAYFAVKAIARVKETGQITTAVGLAMPFVFGETMFLVWLCVYRVESLFSFQSFMLSLGYALCVFFTLFLLCRRIQIRTTMKLLTGLVILVFLSPCVTIISSRASWHSSSQLPQDGNEIKHVILIIVDTLRADALSCYDSANVDTPNMDQLAEDGIRFTKAISAAPWTLPSVCSIMTGLAPSVHMATGRQSRLPDAATTLAEYLRNAGYFTAGIGLNPFLCPKFKVSQGFVEYDLFPKPSFGNSLGAKVLRRLLPKHFREGASTADLTDLAVNWVTSNYGKDFFLWIHYYDPHLPYAPPARFLPESEPLSSIGVGFSRLKEVRGGYFVPSSEERQWIKALYDSEVRYVDESIGRLIAVLKRLNLYDQSLIVLTSDHGEEFWEHGGFEHGHTLYNEVLWVPLIIKLPSSASKGEINNVISTASITPTILDVCGIGYEGDHLSVGSLLPLWGSNPEAWEQEPLLSTALLYYEDLECVSFDEFKYIRSLDGDREELYNLINDPEERLSIVSSLPGKVEKAVDTINGRQKKAAMLRDVLGIRQEEAIELDKETVQQLKSLGYM